MTLRDVIENYVMQTDENPKQSIGQWVDEITQAIEREGFWVPKVQSDLAFIAEMYQSGRERVLRAELKRINPQTVVWHDWLTR